VVAILVKMEEPDSTPPASSTPPPAPSPRVTPPIVPAPPPEPPIVAPTELAPIPEGVVPPEMPTPAPQQRRHAPPPRVVAPAPASPTPPAGDDMRSLLDKAREAYVGGQPERCLELVDQAIARGAPPIALRLQGDCHRRRGDDRRALASYERFCAIAGDHPAIGEVRGLVDAMGGRCR
jgi:hypothetical protein